MKTSIQAVTPEMARKWLKQNTDNRPLRPFVVQGLRDAWERGEWKTTHQGIAFAKSGRLLDGQHRLTFIASLPDGESVLMNVTTDCSDDLFEVIDQGARRTLSDITGASAGLVAVGRFFAKIANSSGNCGLTASYCMPFIEWVQPEYEDLLGYCSATCKVFSASAVRAAAIYQIKQGHDADFVKLSYDSLVRADIDAMPHAARTLMQQRMSGKLLGSRSLDLFCRSMRAFDSTRKEKIKSIIIQDQTATLSKVRDTIAFLAKKSPARAGQSVAKPAINFSRKAV